jgi:hypothetical protein
MTDNKKNKKNKKKKKKSKKKRKLYEQRSDLEKCQAQWWKLTGLHNREESSAAIVRAVTAAEIACNYAIRTELGPGNLQKDFIDTLLRDANGLRGKVEKLLKPLVKGTPKATTIGELRNSMIKINKTRNLIVHAGYFNTPEEAGNVIATTRDFILGLVHLYDPTFELVGQKERPTE